jgi:hypothetical protein
MANVYDQRYKSWIDPGEPVRIPGTNEAARKSAEVMIPEPMPESAAEPASEARTPELQMSAGLKLDQVLQGIVLAEILGPPVSRRQGRIRRR